jgi:hypothetical protein
MNLLKETEDALRVFGLQPRDVVWIGSRDGRFAIPWKNYKEVADVEYSDQDVVVRDLVVVGNDWWMERACDRNHIERWSFKAMPWRWLSSRPFATVLFSGEEDDSESSETLASLNGEGDA